MSIRQLTALRVLSVVFALATVPLCFDLGRRLAGTTAGVAAGVAAGSSQMLAVYGSFGRMYALLAFVSTLAVDLFVRAVQTRTRGAVLAAVGSAWLLPATHPFGIVLLAAEAVVTLFVWRRRTARSVIPRAIPSWAAHWCRFSSWIFGSRIGSLRARTAVRASSLRAGPRRCSFAVSVGSPADGSPSSWSSAPSRSWVRSSSGDAARAGSSRSPHSLWGSR